VRLEAPRLSPCDGCLLGARESHVGRSEGVGRARRRVRFYVTDLEVAGRGGAEMPRNPNP